MKYLNGMTNQSAWDLKKAEFIQKKTDVNSSTAARQNSLLLNNGKVGRIRPRQKYALLSPERGRHQFYLKYR